MSFTKRYLFESSNHDERVECDVGPCFGRATSSSTAQEGMELCHSCTQAWLSSAERTANLPLEERKRAFLERRASELPSPWGKPK
jgi:hypothetical protein